MRKPRKPATVVQLPCRTCRLVWESVPCPVCVRGLGVEEAAELERLGELELRVADVLASCFQRGRLRNDSMLDCAHGRPLGRSCADCANFSADFERAVSTADGGSKPPHCFTLSAAPGDELASTAMAALANVEMPSRLVIPHLLVSCLDAHEAQRSLVGAEERLRQGLSEALRQYYACMVDTQLEAASPTSMIQGD